MSFLVKGWTRKTRSLLLYHIDESEGMFPIGWRADQLVKIGAINVYSYFWLN